MEVGMVAIDGIPRQEVRFGQFVATLVEVGPHRHAARMAQMVRSHHVEWDDEGYFQVCRPFFSLNVLRPKEVQRFTLW